MQLFLKIFTFIFLYLISFSDVSAENIIDIITDRIKNYSNAEEITLQIGLEEKKYLENHMNTELLDINIDEKYRKFTVELLSPDQQKFQISGRYEDLVTIPVVLKKIQKGEIITQNYISLITVSKHKLHPETIFDEQSLIGKTTSKFILNNKPILSRDIIEPYLVRKNEAITVRYQSNNLNLILNAIALEDGIKGQLIKVKNPSSNHILNAIVTSDKNAHVPINY